MTIDGSVYVLWAAAFVLGALTWRKGRDRFVDGLKSAAQLGSMIIRLVPLAILSAGFLAQIVPNEWVAGAIGEDSGFQGILIASVAGGLVPSGPFVSFPIALTLYNTGAGLVPLIAFITGWSVFAVHRLFIYEFPLLGAKFTLVRMAASLALPPLTAVLAGLLFDLIRALGAP